MSGESTFNATGYPRRSAALTASSAEDVRTSRVTSTPPGRDELLTLVFGQGRTAGSPQPCDGPVLFGRKRGRFSEPIGQATVTPGVIVQQTSETPGQCVRGIEHRNIGALQLGESRRVAPASRPQEHQALASALSETDH